MKFFANLSISKKLLIVLLLVSLLPIFLMACGFYHLGKARLAEQTIRLLDVQAKNVTVSINNFIGYKFKHLKKIANIPQLISALKTEEKAGHNVTRKTISSLRAKLSIDPDFLAISLLNSDGDMALSTRTLPDEHFKERPVFFETMKGIDYVSTPSLDGNRPSIYFGVPVKYNDEIIGVVVAQCRAEELWNLVETESERVGHGNAVIVSNSDGVRIAHSTRRDLIFKSWSPLEPQSKEQILKEKRYGRDIKEISSTDIPEVMDVVTQVSPSHYFQHRLVIGKGLYHSVTGIMGNGWRVICTVPETTFLEPIYANIFYMVIIVCILISLVVVVSVIIGRKGTRRINILTTISREIAKGDFTKTVPVTNGDEIGQLGKTFNTMVASINRKIEQLKYLNDVAVEIHSHIEIERLLHDLVNISHRIINAETGVLALLDDTGVDIKHFEISMPNQSEPRQKEELLKCKGLLGAVVMKGQTLRLDNILEDPRSLGLPSSHPPIRTLLGVPLTVNNTLCGGLFLVNKASGERFTLEEEEILFTIACQASVAIENARLYGEVQHLAITDGLTGLLNHKEFHRRLNENIEGSKRYQYEVSLLMIDIDHFKHFNDTYGHKVGDHVLKTVGDVIKAQARVVDTCARYGGEEFAVITRDADTPQAITLSERIRSTIYAYPFKHNGIRSQLSVSIGIASFPQHANNAEDLIQKADGALYTAKKTGRNRVFCYNRG